MDTPPELRAWVESGRERIEIELGKTDFRTLERIDEQGFGLRVNGVDIFCRGACWTPLDPATLSASPEQVCAALAISRTVTPV